MVRVHLGPLFLSDIRNTNNQTLLRGLSSAGRAPALHAGGQRFDPARLHQKFFKKVVDFKEAALYTNKVALTKRTNEMIFEN